MAAAAPRPAVGSAARPPAQQQQQQYPVQPYQPYPYPPVPYAPYPPPQYPPVQYPPVQQHYPSGLPPTPPRPVHNHSNQPSHSKPTKTRPQPPVVKNPVSRGSSVMPKNHAKVRGGTREDVNGRVHTKLIQKLQSGAIDVKKMIARQKKQNEPLPPPPGIPRGASTGGSSSSHDFNSPSRDYNYAPPGPQIQSHSQPERGVIYP